MKSWQFMMAVGIWLSGLMTVMIKCIVTATPIYYFHPLALTSGIIWSIGNILTVLIIKTIGLALGMSIFLSTQLIVGWSTGKWGLLGTPKDTTVKHDWLNYLGVLLVIISLLLFFMVKPDNIHDDNIKKHIFNPNTMTPENSKSIHTIDSQQNILIAQTSNSELKYDRKQEKEMVSSWIDRLSLTQKNIVGIVCSIISGICYGVTFCPIQYIIHNQTEEKNNEYYSGDMIDYIFIVYNGIFFNALFFFIIYNIYMGNKPQINKHAVFPSILGGIIWAIGMNAYFVALDKNNLGVETTFPIASAGPQIISSLWGVLYYKEIKGKRNIIFLFAAIFCSLLSVAAVSLSKFRLYDK